MLQNIDQLIYERAGFSEEHARQLANMMSVVRETNARLRSEGKPDLLEQLRQKRAKAAEANT